MQLDTAVLRVIKKTIPVPGTPQSMIEQTQISTFQRALIIGKKDWRTNNTGNVFLGINNNANEQPWVITPGEQVVLEAPPGQFYDWKQWWLDAATAGDGVVTIFS